MKSRSLAVYALGALFIGGTYPFALLGQFGTNVLYGDGEIVGELTYGPHRVLAAELVDGWLGSLVWVICFWLVIEALARVLPRLYVPVILALATAALAAALARLASLPTIFGWLALAALVLRWSHSFIRSRFLVREVACDDSP